MFNNQRLKAWLSLPSRRIQALRVSREVGRLDQLNKSSKTHILNPTGPVVSLTSYGKRVLTVYLTIESIAQGTLLPSRMILWLDEQAIFDDLPDTLIRLKQRGLEICRTRNYGPHKKYYPYVESHEVFDRPLATADDDIIYPVYWLRELSRAFVERPDLINCYRARVVAFQSEQLGPYKDWRMCCSTEPTSLNFATGVSGVIYPPRFLSVLKKAGLNFQSSCPNADDIWLHVQALRANFKVRQFVKRKDMHFPSLPETQNSALYKSNRASGNDRQAAMTYSQHDIMTLRESIQSLPENEKDRPVGSSIEYN